jgi:DNA-binding CsgD family transcriptional regulator
VIPLVVCEGRPEDADDIAGELGANGWRVIAGFDVPGGVPPDGRIVCIGDVRDADDAGRAVLVAVWGAGVLARARAERDVVDHLCEDLRRLGPLEHLTSPRPKTPLDAEQRALVALLAGGNSLGDAASELHISRRTADRRLAAARSQLGVETTAEAIFEAKRLGLV